MPISSIESTQKNASDDRSFERRTASNGQPYFVLKAANTQIIGQSELYSSKVSMANGIASVKRNAPVAPLQDSTTE